MSNGNRVLNLVAGEDVRKFFLLSEQGTIKLSSCDANQNMDCLEASQILQVGCHLGSEKIVVNGEELAAITGLDVSSSSNLATHSQTVWRAMEHMNNFEGMEIPKFIRSLGKLRYLNLSGESFDGLSSLKYLNLGGIDLSKAIAYWLQTVNTLHSLLSCTCPTVNFPTFLFLFHFSILPLFPSLVYLDLNSNNLQGGLPDAFQNFTSLQLLYLSKTSNIEGEFPRTLGNFTLENLDLGFNKLTGTCQIHWVQFQNQLGAYPLYRNYTSRRIKWVIPNSLGQLSSLVVQELNENSWEGVITEAQFANLSSLKQLSVTKSTPNVSLVLLLFSSLCPFSLSTCAPHSSQHLHVWD
ncbi:hypothetical protein AAG906_009789 [Vitis piasezkii]